MKDEGLKAGITRRKVLIAGAISTPAFALMTGKADAKIQHSAVKYQAEPKDGKQCSGCNFFVAPNACKQVDGNISPLGYCLLWAKKPS
jgi:hypothetical protein